MTNANKRVELEVIRGDLVFQHLEISDWLDAENRVNDLLSDRVAREVNAIIDRLPADSRFLIAIKILRIE